MTHKPIQINNLSLTFPHKICFEEFSSEIRYGSHIAIIGSNGSGKSTLLQILQGIIEPTSGDLKVAFDVAFGYVPQVIITEDCSTLSGGERLNTALTRALSLNPNVLLLDEPTNHLDLNNRKSFMRMLRSYPGTLIIVSHDQELLRTCIDTLWHIDNGKINIFSGYYDDYIREINLKRISLEQELQDLDRQKRAMHTSLMQEQQRAAKSRVKGEKSIKQRKWPTITSNAKARRAEETSGRKKSAIDYRKQELSDKLADLRLPEIINPKFSLLASSISPGTILSISNGTVGYHDNIILQNINLALGAQDRMAIQGNNGSGKSTLVKAILNDHDINKSGGWFTPKTLDIGYIDQHYSTLSPNYSVLETIAELVPHWSHTEIRCHLNDFLFRKNEEVNALVKNLSGGEKARLSLAQIAAKTPKLLILDEITNNLDLITKDHVVQVLKNYPGAMIVISHEPDFLDAIGINDFYAI